MANQAVHALGYSWGWKVPKRKKWPHSNVCTNKTNQEKNRLQFFSLGRLPDKKLSFQHHGLVCPSGVGLFLHIDHFQK